MLSVLDSCDEKVNGCLFFFFVALNTQLVPLWKALTSRKEGTQDGNQKLNAGSFLRRHELGV